MVETWALFAITTVLLCGVSGIVSKLALNNAPSSVLVIASFIIIMPASLILLAYYILFIGLEDVELGCVALGIVAAVFANLGFFLYFDALEKGPVLLIGSITSAYPAAIVVVAILLMGDQLTLIQAIGTITVITGVVTLLYIHGTATGKAKIPRIALLLSVLTVFSWTTWGISLKTAFEGGLDVLLYLGLATLVMPPLTIGYLKLRNRGTKLSLPKYSLPLILAIISVELEQLGFYTETLAVSTGQASLVFPIVASYPVVTVVLAYAFLKERLSLRETLLVLAVVTGIALVAVI
jgi:transporter family protein